MEDDVIGYCDYFTLSAVRGWAVDRRQPERPVTVKMVFQGEVVAETSTGLARDDLPPAHGAAGFAFEVTPALRRHVGELSFVAGRSGSELLRVSVGSAYQAVGERGGASDSEAKLTRLELPQSLTGLSFLDVGCNEGFFCDVALKRGAARAVGVEQSPAYVERGRALYPDVEFVTASWDDDLPPGQFDVILLASALHYAADPSSLLKRLRTKLTDRGMLILEAGVAKSPQSAMVTVMREGDIRSFPTEPFLREVLLSGYATRKIGPSIAQSGDPVPRFVFHCHTGRPVALLVSGPPGAGKSLLAHLLQRRHCRAIEADVVISTLQFNGLLAEWPNVMDFVTGRSVGGFEAAYAAMMEEPALLRLFLSEMCATGGMRGELDVYVVPDVHGLPEAVTAALVAVGYVVWTTLPASDPTGYEG